MKSKLLAAILCAATLLTGCSTAPVEDATVDVDLTTLSSTMVYSEVYNIMSNPESYRGKSIKVDGLMFVDYDPELNSDYYAVIIEDATACCQQGIEFVCEHMESLPADGTKIEVTGEFGSYDAPGGGCYYCIYCDSVKEVTNV